MGTIPAPNIAGDILGIQRQNTDSMAEYARAAQLRQQTEQAQAQAPLEIQKQQMANQQAQMDLQDAQNARKLGPQYVQKDKDGKPTGFDNEGYYGALIASGMNPAKVQAQRQANVTLQQGMVNLSKDQLDLHNKRNDQAYEITEPLRQAANDKDADVGHINTVWPRVAHQLAALGVPMESMPASFASPQEAAQKLQDFETELGQHKQVIADAKTVSETAEKTAKARHDNAEAAHQELINNLTSNSKPGDFDKQVDALVPPSGAQGQAQNAFVKSQVNASLSRGDMEGAKKFIDQAYQNQLGISKDIAVQTNPQIQAGKVAVAGAEAKARQEAAQGDPAVAGKMLADGSLTLADLKSRGTTPQYITKAVSEAQKINPKYNPADEVIAEQVAKSPSANQFFGSANSLITKGGTLDQLEQLGKRIPEHDFPVLNTIDDWQALARGKGPLAGYAATALGAADDYGKVMGGGNASDHARDAALALFAKAASPDQRAEAIKATRAAVQSQRDSRIGNNQFLKRQYGTGELGGEPQGHIISVNGKRYQYKGAGATDDLANYTELK